MTFYHQLSSGSPVASDVKLFESETWSIEYMCHLQSQLHQVCQQLEDKDHQEWSRHTSAMEESSWILPSVRDTIDPELLTRAWLKMRELLGKFNLLANLTPGQPVNGLFLCEAPGAFVASVNHWIREKEPSCHFNWKACTLNPYHESLESTFAIFDDRLYKSTHDNWILSPHDNTGSIMHVDFLPFLRETLESNFKGQKVSFVTADGGVSCINDPENQETKLTPLIFTEMILALDSLEPGGFFILKTFSLFHCNSLSLCYYLSQVFDCVNMAKPITSKAGNSEVYLVCIGFRGVIPHVHQQLLTQLTSGTLMTSLSSKCMFSRQLIPLDFILNFQQAITLLTYKQKRAVNQNLSRFKVHSSGLQSDLILIKKRTCRKFFHLNKIYKIPPESRLVKGSNVSSATTDAFDHFLCHPMENVRIAFKKFINHLKLLESITFCQGSLKDRRLLHPLKRPSNRHLIDSLCQQDLSEFIAIFSQWHTPFSSHFNKDNFNIISQPQVESKSIYNSKFVSPSLLNLFKQIQPTEQTFVLDNVKSTNINRQLDELLLNLLAQVTENPLKIDVISSGKHEISSHLTDILSALSPEKRVFPSKEQINSKSTFYVRHVTSYPSTCSSCTPTTNTEEDFGNSILTSPSSATASKSISTSNCTCTTNGPVHLHPLAMEQFLDLLEWIEFILASTFKEGDILGVSVDHSLDRLTVGLMYLLCKSFHFYTLLPRSPNWLNPKTVPGHIFIFALPRHTSSPTVMSWSRCNNKMQEHIHQHQDRREQLEHHHHLQHNNSGNGNGYSPNTEGHLTHKSNDHLHDIRSYFTRLKCTVNQHLRTQPCNPVRVLELVSVPQMLQDDAFFTLVYCVNALTLIDCLAHSNGH